MHTKRWKGREKEKVDELFGACVYCIAAPAQRMQEGEQDRELERRHIMKCAFEDFIHDFLNSTLDLMLFSRAHKHSHSHINQINLQYYSGSWLLWNTDIKSVIFVAKSKSLHMWLYLTGYSSILKWNHNGRQSTRECRKHHRKHQCAKT